VVNSLIAGVAAGLGIAIPVGAIAILIVETGVRRGLRVALAAGAGAATADGLYALLAALGGVALAGVVEPIAVPLRAASAAVLVGLAVRGLMAVRPSARAADSDECCPPSVRRTYAQLVGLTILNPMTIVYFAALILGLPSIGSGTAEKLAFVGGAFAASLLWQSLLGVFGSVLHHRLPVRFRLATSILGNLVILAFAASIASGLIPR
jgi:threonine/homoserine/homoserine lactone efflux protein